MCLVDVDLIGRMQVTTALMDGEFQHLCGEINVISCDEHVGDIEHYICTIKGRMRATYNMLPFTHILIRLIIKMGKAAVFWLNSLPSWNGISGYVSPCTIITGQTLNYKWHSHFQFGEYVQMHEDHDNSMNPQMIGMGRGAISSSACQWAVF